MLQTIKNKLSHAKHVMANIMNSKLKISKYTVALPLTLLASSAFAAVGDDAIGNVACNIYTITENWFRFGGIILAVLGLFSMSSFGNDLLGGVKASMWFISAAVVFAIPYLIVQADAYFDAINLFTDCAAVTAA